ncbi:MAG: ABC-F family ATP-binding cassette domain-containing protein [Myxococcales bacterium]|nr:ABC-F family ATP-binding cassette domain-containing protein [Myxococcales bacterium]
MTPLLSCQKLAKSFAGRLLFEGLSLSIAEGERVGLIGPNGCGKSTFLRILSGLEDADSGEIATRRRARIAYVPQSHDFPPSATVEELVLAEARTLERDPHEQEVQALIAINRVGFDEPKCSVSTLSGGWIKRLAIASALVRDPDLMILDEPTNHLDLEGIGWLEALITGSRCATLVVTHDRVFLERVATRIVEINPRFPEGFFAASGSYSQFVEKRSEMLAAQLKEEESLASKVRREVEWLRQGPKARTSKARYRLDEAKRLMDQLRQVGERNLESEVEIDFQASRRKTKRLLVADGIGKRYGREFLFRRLGFVLTPGMRLGLLGANGSGKSTLLKAIAGSIELDEGEIRRADGLRIVVFDQHRETLDPALSLRRTLGPHGDELSVAGRGVHVMAWARKFLFRPEQLDQPVSSLSGGEQARLLIARLMLQPADLLLLDEPTNDLDIPTLEVLESALLDFPGAMVLVSHDRYLLDQVCNLTIGLHPGGAAELYADYWQWDDERQARKSPRSKVEAPSPAPREAPSKKRLSYLEKREFEAMEETILAAEDELESARSAVADPAVASDADELSRRYAALQKAEGAVERLYARWAELEAKQG